jgi:hypothetical protein
MKMKERNIKKEKIRKYLKNVYKKTKCTYVCISNTDKDCDLLHDRPVLSSGRTPHDEKTAPVLTIAKGWS